MDNGIIPIDGLVTTDNIGTDPGQWQLIAGPLTSTNDDNMPMEIELLIGNAYQLVETAAPPGFQLPLGQWRISVSEDGSISSIPVIGDSATPAFVYIDGTWYLGNRPAFVIPLVGGSGYNILFFIVGILIIILALGSALQYTRKRNNKT